MLDAQLKTLADCGLAVEAAEAALAEAAHGDARERLDEAAAALEALRGQWPSLGAAQRAVVGPAAKTLRDRVDAAQRRVPPLRAVSDGAPEVDPEQESEPAAA